MSSHASVTPLYLESQPSHRLLRLLLWSHLASAGLLIGLALHFLWPALLLPPLWFSHQYYRRRTLQPVRLARESDGGWLWHRGDDTVVPVRILPETLLTPWLVVLHLREEGGRRHAAVLLGDSLPPGQFRALRVALRLERV
ncbi:protein YgfX [Sulfurivermis fontis]|uniref:protein YgfX n=1 Tax=Sulfurivermis fontis TaxID=1972068 RepID=UPI000FDCA35A|nr:protein YgfX [Sulfurivermis fontis]